MFVQDCTGWTHLTTRSPRERAAGCSCSPMAGAGRTGCYTAWEAGRHNHRHRAVGRTAVAGTAAAGGGTAEDTAEGTRGVRLRYTRTGQERNPAVGLNTRAGQRSPAASALLQETLDTYSVRKVTWYVHVQATTRRHRNLQAQRQRRIPINRPLRPPSASRRGHLLAKDDPDHFLFTEQGLVGQPGHPITRDV